MKLEDKFEYNKDTGALTVAKTGRVVGSKMSGGYLQFQFRGVKLLVHRAAWDLANPEDKLKPGEEIDHIDHNKINNKLSNLRKVTSSENLKNKSKYKNNKSGVIGVHFESARSKWVAKVRVNGRNKHLGYFSKLEDAVAAREEANKHYGFHHNHGGVL